MAGLEVEGIEKLGELPDSMVVAEILERRPHPNADSLSVCRVNDSGDEVQIVCGAHNCDAGKKVVLARVGTVMPGDDGFKIKKAKIRGEASFGMMCSERELGLGDDHDGILLLDDDAPLGTLASEVIGGDTVIDWEVTPNRPDWLSHIGIAREVGALTGDQLRLPTVELDEADGPDLNERVSVDVEDADLCPRYTARLIDNVTVGPSPKWMQDYLAAVGLRPINNVVDITNFVLLECGQPLHAFDFSQLAGGRIVVRRAAPGEKMQTLDEKEFTLVDDHLLIADAERGVALAGVMGGFNSEISDSTTTVLLESAAFHPPNIRATSRGLGIITDSSYRFERGVDLEMVEYASARAAQLICEYAGGTLVKGLIDVRKPSEERHCVSLRYERARRLIGADITDDEIREILSRLQLVETTADADSCTVRIPPFRHDLEREVDLIEEVARLYGLNKIPSAEHAMASGGTRRSDTYYTEQKVRSELIELGLVECVHFSFISAADATRQTGIAEADLVEIANPLSAEFQMLRPTVQTQLIQAVAHNIAHGNKDLRLFELGRVYSGADGQREERRQVGIAITGSVQPEQYGEAGREEVDFFDLKGLMEAWLDIRRAVNVSVVPHEHPGFTNGACAALMRGEKVVAVFGRVHDRLLRDIRLQTPLFMALVEFEQLLRCKAAPSVHQGTAVFPSTARDMSFIAAESLAHADVVSVVERTAGKLLESVHLFDIFRDAERIGSERKSMAYSLTFRAADRTLKDKEVDKIMAKVSARLADELPIEYR
jgi:phenylalanyl-tRNA synthetase beta chain